MRTFTTVSVSFEAGHTVFDRGRAGTTDEFCAVPNHGHRWRIAVTADTIPDYGDFLSAVQSVIDEISGRNLNDMLPGVVTSPQGLGLYIRERLALDWPRITKIQVDMGPFISSTIDWEIR